MNRRTFFGRRARTPVVLQMEAAECGAAALGSVLAYHGLSVPLEELRRACGVSRDGSRASRILNAARHYGFAARGMRCEVEGLAALQTPGILFWHFNHFVVYEGCNRRGTRFFLNDPAVGPRTVGREEFNEGFTGVALRVEPGPNFSQRPHLPGAGDALGRVVAETPGLWIFSGVCAVILAVPGLAIPALIRVFFDDVLVAGETSWLPGLAGGLVLAAILLVAGQALQGDALWRWKNFTGARDTERFLRRLLGVPLGWGEGRHPVEMARRVFLPEENARLIAEGLAPAVMGLPLLIGLGVVFLLFDPLLAGGSMTLLALGLVWPRTERDASRTLDLAEATLTDTAMQGVAGLENSSPAGADTLLEKLKRLRRAVSRDWQRATAACDMQVLLQDAASGLALAVVVAGGGARLLAGDLTAGTLVAMGVIIFQMHRLLENWRSVPATWQRLQENTHRLSDIPDTPVPEVVPGECLNGLEVRDLTFGYSRWGSPVLRELTMDVKPGCYLAVVGTSGSGKSTLLKVLAGWMEPDAGQVLLNGAVVCPDRFAACGRWIGVSAGGGFPMSRSGIESEENFLRALKCVGIEKEEIARFEGGVGESFSRGERQRLELARHLAANPGLLLLDQSLSAVDAERVRAILREIRRSGCAVVHVTSSRPVLEEADEILVLDEGSLVARGTFSELDVPGSLFREVVGP